MKKSNIEKQVVIEMVEVASKHPLSQKAFLTNMFSSLKTNPNINELSSLRLDLFLKSLDGGIEVIINKVQKEITEVLHGGLVNLSGEKLTNETISEMVKKGTEEMFEAAAEGTLKIIYGGATIEATEGARTVIFAEVLQRAIKETLEQIVLVLDGFPNSVWYGFSVDKGFRNTSVIACVGYWMSLIHDLLDKKGMYSWQDFKLMTGLHAKANYISPDIKASFDYWNHLILITLDETCSRSHMRFSFKESNITTAEDWDFLIDGLLQCAMEKPMNDLACERVMVGLSGFDLA